MDACLFPRNSAGRLNAWLCLCVQEAEEKAEREAEKEKAEKEKGEKFASGKPKKGRVATEDDLFAEVDKDDEKEDEKKDDDKKVTPRCFSAPQHLVLLGLACARIRTALLCLGMSSQRPDLSS